MLYYVQKVKYEKHEVYNRCFHSRKYRGILMILRFNWIGLKNSFEEFKLREKGLNPQMFHYFKVICETKLSSMDTKYSTVEPP